jgi:zinc protease
MGTSLDQTRFWVYAVPAEGVSLEELDGDVIGVINDLIKAGIDEADLARAKTRLIADAVYAQDSQTSLARWYGAALTTGSTIQDIREWPDRIDAVGAEDIRQAAKKWLDTKRSVLGLLKPEEIAA